MATPLLLKSAVVGAAFMASSSLWAAECSDVIWAPATVERFPNIYNVCQAVVEQDGKHYVEVQAKFVSLRDQRARINFKNLDGKFDKTVETKVLPEDFTVLVDGKQKLLREVERDTELTIYVPSDRFVLVSDLAHITVVYEFEDEVAPAKP
jgi:hypothetical protein